MFGCNDVRELLSPYLEGELEDDQAVQVQGREEGNVGPVAAR
mgnify:CR=1 FL=1